MLEGGADIRLTIPDLNINTDFKVGLGVQFQQFTEVRLLSDVNQKIVVAISQGRVDDSRITGTIDTVQKGGTSYSTPATVALVASTAKEILAQDATRLKASVQCDADIYLGSDNTVTTSNGIKAAADSLINVDNSGALWAICDTAESVRVLEEFS